VEGMREMGETSVEVSFCDAGNLDGSIDESVEFFGPYYVRDASVRQDNKHHCQHASNCEWKDFK
jgi:hypothetical protein